MNLIVIASLLAALVASTDAWMAKQLASFAIGAVLATTPNVADATVAPDFSGSYSDPNHPNCQRIISVDGTKANLKGTDGNPGCPADGSGAKWYLTGKVDGSSILVDFTPKGGPADLKGVWDNNGIRWPDGNKWSKK
eukprot:CAMPEP_0194032712 /NCGR_PEP_ID=MMETSP0009_2-20130614/5596_1 /TAXON_ID=210454 /ORGANISM="Grammatophora oceanica, Strain CCMP 410" /LENGTH=136 /DNA_ID=CAMNT_0038673237 /DNA_START=45 /DNA_END=455 /DNA_ORIENTATION=-